MERIDENAIKSIQIYGKHPRKVLSELKQLVDIVYGERSCSIDYDFFDIKGTVLLSGIPGTGKTSIVNNVIAYALEKYSVDAYTFFTTDIIEADLGKTVANFRNQIDKFSEKEQGILFIDEIDKFCVNRSNSEEVSEMKRLLIELMSYIDSINISNGKMIIGCTNVINQLDDAIIRRFSIWEEIQLPSDEEKNEYAAICRGKMGEGLSRAMIGADSIHNWKTFDDIKKYFRAKILRGLYETTE